MGAEVTWTGNFLPDPLPPNFVMSMGEGQSYILWSLHVAKTPENEVKWAHFFEYFPFKLVRWD